MLQFQILSRQRTIKAPLCLGHSMWKAGPNPLLSPPLTFPEVNQVHIHWWVGSESFPAGLEPATFCATAKRSNHSTTAHLVFLHMWTHSRIYSCKCEQNLHVNLLTSYANWCGMCTRLKSWSNPEYMVKIRCDCVHRSFTLLHEWSVSVAGTECWFSWLSYVKIINT